MEDIERIYNGCGADWMPTRLRKVLTWMRSTGEPAFLLHDMQYYRGGTREDFTKSNNDLQKNLWICAKQVYSWYNPIRLLWWLRARRLAKACQYFGWSAFGI